MLNNKVMDDIPLSRAGRGCTVRLEGSNQQRDLKAGMGGCGGERGGRCRTTGMVGKVFVPNVSEEGRFLWRCSVRGAAPCEPELTLY